MSEHQTLFVMKSADGEMRYRVCGAGFTAVRYGDEFVLTVTVSSELETDHPDARNPKHPGGPSLTANLVVPTFRPESGERWEACGKDLCPPGGGGQSVLCQYDMHLVYQLSVEMLRADGEMIVLRCRGDASADVGFEIEAGFDYRGVADHGDGGWLQYHAAEFAVSDGSTGPIGEREWLITDRFRRMCRVLFPLPAAPPPSSGGLLTQLRRFFGRGTRPVSNVGPAPLAIPTLRQSQLIVAALIECHGCDHTGHAWSPDDCREVARMIERYADDEQTAEDETKLLHLDGRTLLAGAETLMGFCRGDEAQTFLRIAHMDALPGTYFPRLLPERSRVGCNVLRCIIGNPFRSVAFQPVWLTSTVVSLARGVQSGRAFDGLPILADALQEAGCDDAAILNHCRQDNTHARGCWVLDGLLADMSSVIR